MGDPQEADFGYCGRPRGRHVSYCEDHAGVAVHGRSARRAALGAARSFDPFAGL
jgi:hypothetical protein